MKTTILISSIFSIILTGCCPYDANDVQFSTQEAHLIDLYQVGDTLTFINGSDSIQEWNVLKIDTTLKTGCLMEVTDHTIGLTLNNNQKEKNTRDENHIFLSKHPGGKNGIMISLSVFFEDFSGSIESGDSLQSTQFISRNLRGIDVHEIVEIKSDYMERKSLPKDITHVYWSKKYGLTAFKTFDEEIWIDKRWL